MPRWGMRLAAAMATVVTIAFGATACSSDPLAQQYRAGSGKNYVAGDSSVTEFAAAHRGEPVTFSVKTIDGTTVTNTTYLGKVLVINFWYAACAPCRAEAPQLKKLSAEFADQRVSFLGDNVRDGADTARAFERNYGLTYPSVLDTQDPKGGLLLAFRGTAAPNAVPTTLVLDKQGRVAARILGQLDPSILRTLIRTELGG